MFYLLNSNGKVIAAAQSIATLRQAYPKGEYTVAQASGILREGEYVQRISNTYSNFDRTPEQG